jgi:hypothetical protein
LVKTVHKITDGFYKTIWKFTKPSIINFLQTVLKKLSAKKIF